MAGWRSRTGKSLVGLATIAMTAVPASLPALAQDVTRSEIEAPGPQGPLAGTLVSPDPKAPVVLIIPGSGAVNRDGNSPPVVQAGAYKLLAEALATRGIASVRIDKRGMFGSKAAVPDANAVTIGAYAEDVHSWTAAIRKRTGVPCAWVLGHSEGGLVALAAAQQPADICGLILVSTAGEPIGETMKRQLTANPANAPILDQAIGAIDSLEAGKPVDTAAMNPVVAGIFNPAVQPYLIDLFAKDPTALLGRYDGPTLIVQGLSDLQVREADARALAAADPGARLVLLPTVNHMLKTVASDDRAANLATYTDPSLPIAPGVVDAVADFVAAHPHR